MNEIETHQPPPLRWIPSLYYLQGLPFALIVALSPLLYKQFGMSNAKIALYTSMLTLPWAFKPLLAPLFENMATKRFLTLFFQGMLLFSGVLLALTIGTSHFFLATYLVLIIMALSATCNDMTSDGLYIVSLSQHQQEQYVGVRSCFYHAARLTCQGGLVMALGYFMSRFAMSSIQAWQLVLLIFVGLVAALYFYHLYSLPEAESYQSTKTKPWHEVFTNYVKLAKAFKALPYISCVITFLLVYNAAEAQVMKIMLLFLTDSSQDGGLALSLDKVGLVFGVFDVIALASGAMISGLLIAKYSLKKCFLPMTVLMVASNAGYIVLSSLQPTNLLFIGTLIGIAQFSYGCASSVYMTYLLKQVKGQSCSMSLYAVGTALMTLGITLFSAVSGVFQQALCYDGFFIWIMLVGFMILTFSFTIYDQIEEG